MNISRGRLLIIVGCAAIGLLGIGYVTLRGRGAPISPAQAFEIAQKHLKAGRLREAYSHMDYAARQKPEDTVYGFAAARAAVKLRLFQAASGHAREVWNRGLKNKEVFQILVSSVTGDRAARLEKGAAWLRELPEGRERSELEGDLYQSVQKYSDCLRIYLELYASGPAPSLANKIALAHVATDHPETAHEFLKTCRDAGTLDEEGYGLLASLAAYGGHTEESAAAFAEGRARFPSGEGLRLTEAVFLIWQDRLTEAAIRLEPLKDRSEDAATAALHGQARIFLGFIRAAQADSAALDALSALAAGEGPELEGERHFYQGLKERSADALKKARLLLSTHPACDWMLARTLVRAGNWKEAVEVYRGVSGLLAGAPLLQAELAHAYLRAGRFEEALVTLRKLHARRYYTKSSLEMVRDLAARKGLASEAAEAQALLEKRFGQDPTVALAGGVLALQAGDLSKAASILEGLSARHPDRDDVELARISVLFTTRDYEGVLKAAAASRASPASLAPIQAASYVMLGRSGEASDLYERILKDRPDPITALSYANLLLKLGRLDAASQQYDAALRLQPKNGVARLGLATVAARRGDWKSARTHAEAASTGSTEAAAQTLLAECDLQEGRPERAAARCSKALALDPKDERAAYLFGVSCLEVGRYDEAETALRRVIEDRPDGAHVWLTLARVAMARGALGEALTILDRALERRPTDDLAFPAMRVVLLARMGRLKEAREEQSRLSPRLTPERAALCDAWLLHLDGRPAEAVAKLREHLQDPHSAYFWAELTLAGGTSEGVIEALDRHPLDAARWGGLGETARLKGLLSAAAACYKRALRSDPDNPQLLNNFTYASLQLESFDETEVLAAARKVAALMPGHPSFVHTCASALLRCRKERDCVELLEKSPSLLQKSARLLHAHATALERLEKWDAALKSYEACLARPETEGVTTGDLSRASLQRRIDHVRARAGKR